MEENNIIIAKFMGKDLPYINNKGNWEYFVKDAGLINSPNIEDINKFLNFNYHSDWNWLMEVVEKIEKEFCSTNIHYYSQKQMYSVEFLGFNIEYDNSEYGDDKMKILYNSCVKFINFYNKQKEE